MTAVDCERLAVEPEPFDFMRCRRIDRRPNAFTNALAEHERGTGRRWLARQIEDQIKRRRWAQGYLDFVVGKRRPPEGTSAAAGWDEARTHAIDDTTTESIRRV